MKIILTYIAINCLFLFSNESGFSGEFRDTSGCYYLRARYYDSESGSFISKDPIGITGGINSYLYVKSNPVNSVDPTGLLFESIWSNQEERSATHLDDVGNIIQPVTYEGFLNYASGKTLDQLRKDANVGSDRQTVDANANILEAFHYDVFGMVRE